MWNQVHLPHDGLVAHGADNISCPSGCSGRSYIPRVQMWYRKTFAIPTQWLDGAHTPSSPGSTASSIWIEFDGVFRATIVYLNGVEIARHANGYIGFQVPLPKTLLRTGASSAPNVLALFVDPSTGAGFSPSRMSGWC